MVLKAKPFLDAVKNIVDKLPKWEKFKILYLAPSQQIFNQKKAQEFSKLDHLILVAWRYEWIDARFEKWLKEHYPREFEKISIGRYVAMWGEVPAMVVVEAVLRLVEWVLWDKDSVVEESYMDENMSQIEYPQYTRPKQLRWMEVPDILLSWDHQKIKERREQNKTYLQNNEVEK